MPMTEQDSVDIECDAGCGRRCLAPWDEYIDEPVIPKDWLLIFTDQFMFVVCGACVAKFHAPDEKILQ